MNKKANVYYSNMLAGTISETDEGYEFSYDSMYISTAGCRPVSLTLPVRSEVYTSKVLFPFFDGLIPEGWLLNIAIDHWKVKAHDRFGLLMTTCRDTIGAVSIVEITESEHYE